MATRLKTHNEEIDIVAAAAEVSQNRTNYQLEKFVLGQHHSPEMQYRQLVIELNGLLQSKKEQELRIEKTKAEAEELRETGKKSDAIEAKILDLKVKNMESGLMPLEKEISHLQSIFDTSYKYSAEEIEAAQESYWETRLTRVAQLQMLSRQGGVDWAYLDSLQQSGIIEQAIARIPSFDLLTNEQNQLQLGIKDE